MYPQQNVSWDRNEESGLIILQAPRFGVSILNKLIASNLKKATFDVKLDTFGSFVWQRCDGSKSVQQIADELKKEFTDATEETYQRTSTFIQLLRRERYISLRRPDGSVL